MDETEQQLIDEDAKLVESAEAPNARKLGSHRLGNLGHRPASLSLATAMATLQHRIKYLSLTTRSRTQRLGLPPPVCHRRVRQLLVPDTTPVKKEAGPPEKNARLC